MSTIEVSVHLDKTQIVVHVDRKSLNLLPFESFRLEHQVRSSSNIPLGLRLHKNDAAPCGSDPPTLTPIHL
jgi:hypothetical protein